MFVPRAVKRSGSVSINRNKKQKTTISTLQVSSTTSNSTVSKEVTVENLDISIQEEQTNIVPITNQCEITNVDLKTEHISFNEKDKRETSIDLVTIDEQNKTSVNLVNEQTQLLVQKVIPEVDKHIKNNFEQNVVEHLEIENQQIPKVLNAQESVSQQVQENDENDIEVVQEEPVKEYSYQQRVAFAGESICMICGKYGEYICDETDHDVCSLECKKIDIERVKSREIIQQSSLFHAQLTGYTSHMVINSLTEFQIQSILTRNQINVQGKNIPKPILSFTQCNLPTKVMENLQTVGYTQPTSIQMQTIPTALIGRDILASGQTGSGKTASFLIPIISHCYSLSQCYEGKNGPYAIILAPTRELCYQIESLAKNLIRGLLNMKTALLVGGLPMPNQVHRLKQGIQIAIATPGRLIEILNQHDKEPLLNNIHMFVLDEVDMMFKMGFEKQVKEIINKLPLPTTSLQRQTLMFSATIPENIEKLAKSLLKDHIRIIVGVSVRKNKSKNLDDSLSNSIPNIPVKQTVLWVENKSKKKQLFSLLNDPKYYKPPIVIFVESRMGADLLSQAIEKKCNVRSVSIHGDKSQEERMMILQSFLNGEYDIIVSTGVLSRGLNLPDVKMIINFDMATSVDEYVHQVGRAAGNESSGNYGLSSGWGITFINEDHKHLFKKFVSLLKAQPAGRVTPLPSKLLGHGYTLYGNNKPSRS
ncbi:P-loop containing nucleoside triphosphate hydrolase protein [Glomus cerebriforme]|uniref:RNA helicase n=1 Tax=Glomus cerebriforme TaxID=658196 RepID=A0A397SPE4_9GLOM|nr:P-loop containing nucleoside triphosphate hydrolase protein [Glomus cerebriforme]